MKDIFKGFYSLGEAELEEVWRSEETLFVFDASVLLNLYGYAVQTRGDFFKILESVSGDIWIPYHAGLEYQRNRLNVVRNEKSIFNDIESNLVKIQNVFKSDFERLALKRRFPKLFESTEKLEKDIKRSIVAYKKSVSHWDGLQPCVRSHDSIRDKINELFEHKVGGSPVSQEWLSDLYKEGTERFKSKIPPGFKDDVKAKKEGAESFNYGGLTYEKQFGDLIVWKQLIEKATDDKVKNVIFVTDDAKSDWWYTIDSNGEKVVGPLAELQTEIYSSSNIDRFHMYNTSSFLSDGKSYTSVKVEDSSIIDAELSHALLDKKFNDFEGLSGLRNYNLGGQRAKRDRYYEHLINARKLRGLNSLNVLNQSVDSSGLSNLEGALNKSRLQNILDSTLRDQKHYLDLMSSLDRNEFYHEKNLMGLYDFFNSLKTDSSDNEPEEESDSDDDSGES